MFYERLEDELADRGGALVDTLTYVGIAGFIEFCLMRRDRIINFARLKSTLKERRCCTNKNRRTCKIGI